MATFTPPVAYDNPAILPWEGGLANRLFRYFPNRKRYIYVFALSDGTFVQDTPNGFDLSGNVVPVTNTNIPYPYNPWDPSAPYSTSYYIDYTQSPPEPTHTAVSQNPWITKVYMTPTVITSAEQTALTNAGYGGCIA